MKKHCQRLGLPVGADLTAIETSDEADFRMPGAESNEVLDLAQEFAAKGEAVRFLPEMLHYHVSMERGRFQLLIQLDPTRISGDCRPMSLRVLFDLKVNIADAKWNNVPGDAGFVPQ